jgi:DNA adenine methylase
MGGKSNSVKKILPLIPEHKTYVEPFFGGGWIYFAKEKSKVEVINDINGDLVNLFEVLRTQYDEFIERYNFVIKSRELFLKYRETISDEKLSSLERAFRFFYVNQNAFGGLIRYNQKGMCNSPFAGSPDREAQSSFWDLEKLKNAHERLKETIIENDTYEKIIKRYDKPYTLFYFDPPYVCKDGKYNGKNDFDYDNLLEQCKNIKGKFILTLNSEFEEMFNEFNVIHNDVHYSIGCTTESSKEYKEIIVLNY